MINIDALQEDFANNVWGLPHSTAGFEISTLFFLFSIGIMAPRIAEFKEEEKKNFQ